MRDIATGKAVHDLAVNWHFATGVKVSQSDNGFIAGVEGSAASPGPSPQVAILCAAEADWKKELVDGQISPAYGVLESASIARFGARVLLPAECAVLLVGQIGDAKAAAFADRGNAAVRAFVHDAPGSSEFFLFADSSGAWQWNGWQADTRFAYFHVKSGRLVHLIGVDGSFAKWQERDVIRHERAVAHFEWVERNGEVEISSAGDDRIAFALRETVEVMDSVR